MILRMGKPYPADWEKVVKRLEQLHRPIVVGSRDDPATSWTMCGYDYHPWPCRERKILEGYEPT